MPYTNVIFCHILNSIVNTQTVFRKKLSKGAWLYKYVVWSILFFQEFPLVIMKFELFAEGLIYCNLIERNHNESHTVNS